MDAGNIPVAMAAQVIADDIAAIRPADQDGALERELFDDGGNIAGPSVALAIVPGVQGCVRLAMPAQVQGDDAEIRLQVAFILPPPAEMRLRPSVNKEERNAAFVSPFADMQSHGVWRGYGVDFHGISPVGQDEARVV